MWTTNTIASSVVQRDGPIGKIETLHVLQKPKAGPTDNWFLKCGRPETHKAPPELQTAAAKVPIFSLLGKPGKMVFVPNFSPRYSRPIRCKIFLFVSHFRQVCLVGWNFLLIWNIVFLLVGVEFSPNM